MAKEKGWTNKQVFILVIVVLIVLAVVLIVPNLVKNYYQNNADLGGELATAPPAPSGGSGECGCSTTDKLCECICSCVKAEGKCISGCYDYVSSTDRKKCVQTCHDAAYYCSLGC